MTDLPENQFFHDQDALLERLSRSLKKREREVVFLVGAPLSAPLGKGLPGVPGVDGVIELIRQEFADSLDQLQMLDDVLARPGVNRYQAAFIFLQGRRGQQAANEIVRTAVLGAWTSQPSPLIGLRGGEIDDVCRFMDLDAQSWSLNPGTEALGKLIAGYPKRFHSCPTQHLLRVTAPIS